MKRTAPDPEFVLMYRKGITTSKIAALEDVAVTTVRYHLQIAARAEPGIRDEHEAALPRPERQPPKAGLQNLADVIAFHGSQGRLPVPRQILKGAGTGCLVGAPTPRGGTRDTLPRLP